MGCDSCESKLCTDSIVTDVTLIGAVFFEDRSEIENKQSGPHGSGGFKQDRNGDTSFKLASIHHPMLTLNVSGETINDTE
ncbi:hypothetical protein Tco_0245752 [Tanacetum coccineum]